MAWVGEHGKREVIESVSGIPDYDHTKEPFYYDYYKEKWIYKENHISRANGYKRDRQIDDIIEEKLIEGVDGYKEDTYWGEEYEFDNN